MTYSKKTSPLGFIYASPTPSPQELNEHYANKYYQRPEGSYSADYSAEERQYFKSIATVSDRTAASLNFDRSLFDIGCGEGFFSANLQAAGWSIKCCDFSSHGIEQFNPAILPKFQQGDAYSAIDSAVAAGEQFGLVNLQNVLEHVIDPVDILKRMKALVLPGAGGIRIRVPNDYSAFQMHLLERGLTTETWFAPPEHLSYFNNKSLVAILEHCGYEILSLQADFPIEVFLTNQHSNYWKDRTVGKQAHQSRILVENFLVGSDVDAYIEYSSAAAKLGFGRDLVAYAKVAP